MNELEWKREIPSEISLPSGVPLRSGTPRSGVGNGERQDLHKLTN